MNMIAAPGFAVCFLPPHRGGQDTFQESHMPERSRLYSLAPYAIETIWRESLTGYINRLGRTHHISPRAFVAEMILPLLRGTWVCVFPLLLHSVLMGQ